MQLWYAQLPMICMLVKYVLKTAKILHYFATFAHKYQEKTRMRICIIKNIYLTWKIYVFEKWLAYQRKFWKCDIISECCIMFKCFIKKWYITEWAKISVQFFNTSKLVESRIFSFLKVSSSQSIHKYAFYFIVFLRTPFHPPSSSYSRTLSLSHPSTVGFIARVINHESFPDKKYNFARKRTLVRAR